MSINPSAVSTFYDPNFYGAALKKNTGLQQSGDGSGGVGSAARYAELKKIDDRSIEPPDKSQVVGHIGSEDNNNPNIINLDLLDEQISMLEFYLRLFLPESEFALSYKNIAGMGDAEQEKYLLELMERLDGVKGGDMASKEVEHG